MIVEVARISVKAGCGEAFEGAVAGAADIFRRVPGCLSMQILRTLDAAGSYRLLIHWRALEDHVVHFRASAEFSEWRSLITPYLSQPLDVENNAPIGVGF